MLRQAASAVPSSSLACVLQGRVLMQPRQSAAFVVGAARISARSSGRRYLTSTTSSGSPQGVSSTSAGSATTKTASSASTASSSASATAAGSSAAGSRGKRASDLHEQLRAYDEARELMRQGKLVSKNKNSARDGRLQFAVAGLFCLAFMATPLLGKKIAQDEEFRNKYVPAWYDYTVPKPENPWTRQEIHEQMIQIQKDIRERTIRGEFTPEKLRELQTSLLSGKQLDLDGNDKDYPHRKGIDRSKVPPAFDRIHPGLDDDDDLNEE